MAIFMKIYVISVFSVFFFWSSTTILSYTSISPISQLQTQQLMTSHVYYLTQAYIVHLLTFFTQN